MGVILIGCFAVLAYVSQQFGYNRPLSVQPIVTVVLIQLAAGFVFLIAVWGMVFKQSARDIKLPWLIFVGFSLRGIMFFSTPILEYDYYRYLWDGAVLANGVNPFLYSPKEAIEASGAVPNTLVQLALDSDDVIGRVSFPELRTIYPPVAQAAFAAAYLLSPWSVVGLRIVVMIFDVATLVILLMASRSMHLRSGLVTIYWWNPLLVRETINTMHMDIIVMPFALIAIILSIRGQCVWAAIALAFAVATKLWPLALLPVVLHLAWPHRGRLFLSFVLFGLTSVILFLPVFLSGLNAGSGFVAYGQYWEMNDAAYRVISLVVKFVIAGFSEAIFLTQAVARFSVIVALTFWIIWLFRKGAADTKQIWDRCLLIVAAVFLLSPTAFPWYFVWVVPFLAMSPRPSLLLLNCMLPLYYVVYYYRAHGVPETFDTVIIWIEYLPFWALALWEYRRSRGTSRMGIEVTAGSSETGGQRL